jgi:hypothetical protein
MERLETKKISGRTYYYYSKWAWVDGKCRRVWQKYLGTLESIAKAVEGGPAPVYAEIFQWGLPIALWKESCATEIKNETDKLCPKRGQGLSVGEYITIAAINRAICPNSKRSMWDWFSQTALLRHFPNVSKATLTSQRFWDHMDKIGGDNLRQISYALFCSADGHIPLFYDIYEGSRNDAKEFPLMLQKFHNFFKRSFSSNLCGSSNDSHLR